MRCCITDLRNKKVINAKNGCVLGNVCDVEIDTCTGKVVAIVIFGKLRCFGLMGRDDDIKIAWEDISVIGDETILVCVDNIDKPHIKPPKKSPFEGLFR
ncbi:MAG: YlmC/YmxH family sporulation protein [Oscillospiraceae bacterium]|nr:YlmC/YmxH family sporulation protein [Oscillospiraceae bacterium]